MRCHSVGCGTLNLMRSLTHCEILWRAHDAVVRVYDNAGNVIETQIFLATQCRALAAHRQAVKKGPMQRAETRSFTVDYMQ
jgi:hypothetical protein